MGKTYNEKTKRWNIKVLCFTVAVIIATGLFAWVGTTVSVYPYLLETVRDAKIKTGSMVIKQVMGGETETVVQDVYKDFNLASSHYWFLVFTNAIITLFSGLCVAGVMMLYKSNSPDSHLQNMGIKGKLLYKSAIEEDIERAKERSEKTEQEWEDFYKWNKDQEKALREARKEEQEEFKEWKKEKEEQAKKIKTFQKAQ